jgi:alpha-L-rhamnosidase
VVLSKVGYRHIIFKPQPVDDLSFVSYSNNTSYGLAGITWEKEKEEYTMEISVPVGSEATVFIPASEVEKITESGTNPMDNPEIQFIEIENNSAIFKVGSGNYHFEVSD